MARSLWSGSLSFGLLNIPVRMATAVREKQLRFHLLHDDDGVRLETHRICPQDGQEVPWEHVVKGYEIAKDEYVVLTKEELAGLEAESNHAIELEDFVDLAEIDPIFFDATYYLVPDKGGEKAYGLLLEAMTESKKVGIARMVMRGKEHLVAIRPKDDALVLETLFFDDEIIPTKTAMDDAKIPGKATEREVKMAQQIVETLSTDFDPAKYKDVHRERILEAIEKKAKGKAVVVQPRRKKASATTDLIGALEKTLTEARKGRASKGRAGPAHRSKAAPKRRHAPR